MALAKVLLRRPKQILQAVKFLSTTVQYKCADVGHTIYCVSL
jgi:hypothetical protein